MSTTTMTRRQQDDLPSTGKMRPCRKARRLRTDERYSR